MHQALVKARTLPKLAFPNRANNYLSNTLNTYTHLPSVPTKPLTASGASRPLWFISNVITDYL